MSKSKPYSEHYYPKVKNVFNVIILADINVKDGANDVIKQRFDTFWFDPDNVNFARNNGKQGGCHTGSYTEFMCAATERGYIVNVIADYRK